MHVDQETVEIEEFVAEPRPFRAQYEHWERHQWSPFEIDFSVDAESFAPLDEQARRGLAWVFASTASPTSPLCSLRSCLPA